ncbi:MAG TPA: two-component sensor histidine kinase, partial [Leptolyngbyaceae cyanobacterium M65_K2018_010]|nr:two-component sensor histidine kinase [Leptolyngbyaceae cyanobacterium M65_K2018_010]
MGKRPSLRRRLAVVSASLAGGMLVGFALLSGWLTYQAKLERIDGQLVHGGLPLVRPRDEPELSNPEARLAQELGLPSPQAVAFLMIDRQGNRRYQSPQWPSGLPTTDLWAGLPLPSQLPLPEPGLGRRRPFLTPNTQGPTTWRTSTGRWRVVGRVTPLGQGAIAVNLKALDQEMATLFRIYAMTIPVALAIIAGFAWGLAGQALQPVHQLSQTIAQVTAQGLAQRLPSAGVDPAFETLITTFNAMLERLERSFHQAYRFSGDAAHELKTPLAILQGELERAIQQAETGSPLQQTLSHLLDEVSRLSGIVRKLLLLSRADAGQMSLYRAPIELRSLFLEQLEDVPLLAPQLTVTVDLQEGLVVMGDRDLLIQVIQNLLSNAIKYNLPQGWIKIQGRHHADQVQVAVINAAHPLTATDRTHLFDRFYRGDPARAR